MNTSRLEVSTVSEDGRSTVTLVGELDLASVQPLKDALDATPADQSVVVDLAALSFIDSTGLGAFVEFHHQRSESGGVSFRSVPDHVGRLLEITRLDELFAIEQQ